MDFENSLPIEREEVVEPPRTAAVPAAPEKPAWVLKKLTRKHKTMIQMRHNGFEREDIAKVCGCVPQYITMLMKQEVAIEYERELIQETDSELKNLTRKAVRTVGAMMDSEKDEVALRAAETALRANGKLGAGTESESTSAEDVVAHLFSIHNSNIQVNIRKD